VTFLFGIILSSCLIFGSYIIGAFFYCDNDEASVKRFVIRTVLGLGIFSYFSFLVGLFTTKVPMFVVLGLIVFLGLIYKFVIRKERFSFRISSLVSLSIVSWLIIAALALIAFGHFLIAISPLITWDAATQHYLVPKIWLQSGRIVAIDRIIFAEYPSTIELLYMMGLQLGSEWAANIVGWSLSVLLGLAIFSFTSDRINPRAGLIAAVVFFSMPLTIEIFTGGLIDIGYSLFCLMSFWMYLDYRKTENKSRLILAGLFAGWALGSKHLAVEFLAAVFLGVVIYDLFNKKISFKNWMSHFGILFVLALAVALPWYIKSYIHTGNPIHPFLPGLFYGWREVKEPISVHAWSRPDYSRTIISFLSYPWKLTTDFKFIDFWVMGISPLFVGTLPLWWFYRKRFPKPFFPLMILVIAVFMFIAYKIAPSSTRYMLPIFCLMSVLTAACLGYIIDDFKRFGKALVVLVLIVPFVFNIFVIAKRVRDVLPVLTGKQTIEQLYRAKFDGYSAIEWINNNLPDDAVILTTDPKGYFLEREFYIGTAGKQSQILPPWSEKSSDVVLKGWQELGITHLLFNLSKNVMMNSYFVYSVTKGIEEHGELIMTAQQLAELTKMETEYSYKPEEIAEFGTITQTPTKIINGEVYYHLYKEWWEKTVRRDRTQFMLNHYLNLRPHLKEIERFRGAVLYEIDYN